jgi:hypothetical protein
MPLETGFSRDGFTGRDGTGTGAGAGTGAGTGTGAGAGEAGVVSSNGAGLVTG